MVKRLFFYGVLMDRVAQGDVRDLLAGLGPGEPATARGNLYAVGERGGWFPAMIPGNGEVRGVMHPAGSVDLAALDAFEGKEYERRELEVSTAAGRAMADAYVWIEPVGGLELIEHGDFARWLVETGRKPLGA